MNIIVPEKIPRCQECSGAPDIFQLKCDNVDFNLKKAQLRKNVSCSVLCTVLNGAEEINRDLIICFILQCVNYSIKPI